MVHDLQVSQKCYKISRNLGNLIDLLIFLQKACFWCESERYWSQGPEISAWRSHNDDCVMITVAKTLFFSPIGHLRNWHRSVVPPCDVDYNQFGLSRLKKFHMLNFAALLEGYLSIICCVLNIILINTTRYAYKRYSIGIYQLWENSTVDTDSYESLSVAIEKSSVSPTLWP